MNPSDSEKFLNNTLTVDPGLGTGWAYWSGTKYPMTGAFNIKRAKGDKDETTLQKALKEFQIILDRFSPMKCYIEKMEIWGGSIISRIAAFRGDLFLVQSISSGYGTLCSVKGIEYHFIKAREWKGQLPKDAVDLRIIRVNGRKYPEHVSDAVGMGFSLMGIL